ncbi:MAG TPA: type IV pilin-like G/H family protein [Nostocaceae cyanobacterium]|nr:type IV pilin-like G/H family protein [Nostocaceae cyanobacterium]
MLKPELQVKLLNHLNNRKNNKEEGFTLIELLVVVIIIGVLAAIALPSLLGQVNKAKQTEARQNIGAINRQQQTYFLEKGKFATDFDQLSIGVKDTENYDYEINGDATGPIQPVAKTKSDVLKAYFGVVGTYAAAAATSGEALTVTLTCESEKPFAKLTDPPAATPVDDTSKCEDYAGFVTLGQ